MRSTVLMSPTPTRGNPRRERNGLILACLLVIGALFFIPFRPDLQGELWRRILDAGHLPVFFAISMLLHRLCRGLPLYSSGQLICAVVAAFVLAVITEVTQPLAGRSADTMDFLADLSGITGYLLWCLLNSPRARPLAQLGCMLGIYALIGLTIWPPIEVALAQRHRASEFPVLGGFEDRWDLHHWRGHGGSEQSPSTVALSSDYAADGRQSLRVNVGAGYWSGVRMHVPAQDWQGYRRLSFHVFNPGEAFILNIRVDDGGEVEAFGTRFDDNRDIAPGWNLIHIATADIAAGGSVRRLDMADIRRLVLFTGANAPERVFYLDAVKLE